MRTVPAVRELHNRYKGRGLLVIGVHSPEFNRERDLSNVRKAVARLDIPYPVAIDNDFATWRAFGNRFWPALYLVDPSGAVRYRHVGELHQDTDAWREITAEIEKLLPTDKSRN